MARTPAERFIGGSISSNPRNRITFNANARRGWTEAGGYSERAETNIGIKPASNVEVRVGPELDRSRSIGQYVTAVSDATAEATFGRRYVFSTVDQTTLSTGIRTSVAFSPTLTVESYLQPFVSSGDYGPLKQLRAPRTYEFDVYGQDVGTSVRDSLGTYTVDPDGGGPAASFRVRDRDYSFRSFNGSAVVRWEWHRGSTLYVVWQQNRSLTRTATGESASDDRIGRFSPYRETRALFDIPPQNVLQVKVTYWLNP